MMLLLEHLEVRLGPFVLGPVSAAVPMGKVTAILGPNGSGKSTLLRAACGLQRLHAGRSLLDGMSLHAQRSRWRAARVAFVAQRPAVPPALAVQEMVALGRLGRPDAAAVRTALDEVGLWQRRHEPLDRLSEGQRHRVAIARALAQVSAGPGVLAVDEPTASLDPAWSAMLVRRLRVAAESGLAVLLATHDLVFAAACADRAILLRAGGVDAEGACDEVLRPDRLERAFEAPFELLKRPDGRDVAVPRW